MSRVAYKGYIIEANPQQRAENLRWTLHISIERHDGDDIIERTFDAADVFETKEEAIQHCFNFGRQIIDGQVTGCTAP